MSSLSGEFPLSMRILFDGKTDEEIWFKLVNHNVINRENAGSSIIRPNYSNICKFIEIATRELDWLYQHPVLKAKMIHKCYKLLRKGDLPLTQKLTLRASISRMRHNEAVREIHKQYFAKLFNFLANSNLSSQEICESLKNSLSWLNSDKLDEVNTLKDELFENPDNIDAETAFKLIPNLLSLSNDGVDISLILESYDLMNIILNHGIENFADNEKKCLLLTLLEDPQFAKFATKITTLVYVN